MKNTLTLKKKINKQMLKKFKVSLTLKLSFQQSDLKKVHLKTI